MSKADDELFGLKSSRTGEYLHSKSADEMFKELGYKKFKENKDVIRYSNDNCIIIEFYNSAKSFDKSIGAINFKELQAINLKCRELGWIGGEDE